MTLTIDLTEAEHERINTVARRKGIDPSEVIQKLVTQYLPDVDSNDSKTGRIDENNGIDRNHFYFTATREEFNGALDEIARMNKNLPILTDAAFDRENLYEDRF